MCFLCVALLINDIQLRILYAEGFIMTFYTVRDLRTRPADVWANLAEKGEAIITNNGKPAAIMLNLNEENFEEMLAAARQLKAIAAVSNIRKMSEKRGFFTEEEISEEIEAYRKEKKAAANK